MIASTDNAAGQLATGLDDLEMACGDDLSGVRVDYPL
jgi:hypothetical protein